jgi:hypothetical protein
LEPAVQPSASTPYRVDLLFGRFGASDLLRAGDRGPRPVTRRRLTLPAPWRLVAGSEIDTGVQRFASFGGPDGALADLHSVVGLGAMPAGRLIAEISYGPVRTAVHVDPVRAGFEARWTDGEADHRLAAGPISLLAFMRLCDSLDRPS